RRYADGLAYQQTWCDDRHDDRQQVLQCGEKGDPGARAIVESVDQLVRRFAGGFVVGSAHGRPSRRKERDSTDRDALRTVPVPSSHPLRNPRHLQSAKPNPGVPRMKIVVAMTLLSLATGLAHAQESCASKEADIRRQLEHAREQGNAGRIEGLETALSKVRAH